MRPRRPSLAQRTVELTWSSPQVIASRLSGADSAEQARMVMEKVAAGIESWRALAAYSFALQRSLMRDALRHRTWGSHYAGAPLTAWLATCVAPSADCPMRRRRKA